MLDLKQTESFHEWRVRLKDERARALIASRLDQLDRLAYGHAGDAAFALPDLYAFLEAEGYKYTIRLKADVILQENIAHLLKRPAKI